MLLSVLLSVPVSYTHLDVYKRQTRCCCAIGNRLGTAFYDRRHTLPVVIADMRCV